MSIFKFKTPDESTGFLLWKVNNFWEREIKKLLSEFDLTHTQFVVLANIYYISLEKNNSTQIEIANELGIDKMRISNVIKSLLSKGFIIRKEHETDTRAKVVFLTKPAHVLLKKTIKSIEDFDKSFFSKLSDTENFNKELINLLKDKND